MRGTAWVQCCLAVALMGGCTGGQQSGTPVGDSSAASSPAEATASTQPIPTEIDPFRRVPAVTGLTKVAAGTVLRARGFRVRGLVTERSACVGDRQVLRQYPPAGYSRERGSRVTLSVNSRPPGATCGLNLPRAAADLAAVGERFVRFAREPGADAPAETAVKLYLGGRLLHTIPAARAQMRPSYGWLCPGRRGYAGWTCPFSAVTMLVRYPGPIAVTSQPPSGPCLAGTTIGQSRDRAVILTPDESRTCLDYFAVELRVDDRGQVTAVNLIVPGP